MTIRTSSTTGGTTRARQALRDDLVADLYASLPTDVRTLKVVAPA